MSPLTKTAMSSNVLPKEEEIIAWPAVIEQWIMDLTQNRFADIDYQ